MKFLQLFSQEISDTEQIPTQSGCVEVHTDKSGFEMSNLLSSAFRIKAPPLRTLPSDIQRKRSSFDSLRSLTMTFSSCRHAERTSEASESKHTVSFVFRVKAPPLRTLRNDTGEFLSNLLNPHTRQLKPSPPAHFDKLSASPLPRGEARSCEVGYDFIAISNACCMKDSYEPKAA
jgi:hypothetical protein